MHRSTQHGFTLLELALVLIIIALVVGGILIGENLIRASQLKSVTSEMGRYIQAAADFRDKYQALPGDMSNATANWGTDGAGCPGAYTASPHTATCDGDGNGHIGDFYDNATQNFEMFRAWQQLADAGLITGAFTGISGTGSSYNAIIGQNVPASKLKGAGYTLMYTNLSSGSALNWPAIYGNTLVFGAAYPNSFTYGAVLTPAEAEAIDTKLDDGFPATGNILAPRTTSLPNCLTSDNASTAAYNSSYADAACSLFYITGF